MTRKRFGMYQNTLYDDGNILNLFNAMKLLNHFDKENTKLKKENEQLKKENEILKRSDYIADCEAEIMKLREENQTLKKQNKRLHDDLHKVNQIARGY